jgi:fusarinine C synthase
MGFLHVTDTDDHSRDKSVGEPVGELVDGCSPGRANGNGFKPFEVDGLASKISLTGMRDEVLLLSWLIILLRTREDGIASYDWVYKSQADGCALEPVNRMAMNEIMAGVQSEVGQAAAVIYRQITAVLPSQLAIAPDRLAVMSNQLAAASHPVSLLLSTSSLSHMVDANDNVSR